MALLLIPLGRACRALEAASPSSGFFLLIQKPYNSTRAAKPGTFGKAQSCRNIRREPWSISYDFSANMIFAMFGSPVEQLRQEKVTEDVLGWESDDNRFFFFPCYWFSCGPEKTTSPSGPLPTQPDREMVAPGGSFYSLICSLMWMRLLLMNFLGNTIK